MLQCLEAELFKIYAKWNSDGDHYKVVFLNVSVQLVVFVYTFTFREHMHVLCSLQMIHRFVYLVLNSLLETTDNFNDSFNDLTRTNWVTRETIQFLFLCICKT